MSNLNFPIWYDEWQARKAGTTLPEIKAKWTAVMHDAPDWVRPGATALDEDGDQFIFIGPGGYRDDEFRPAGILAVYSYKGEFHFVDLSDPDGDFMTGGRWSRYRPTTVEQWQYETPTTIR